MIAFIVVFLSSGGFAAVSVLIASFMKTRERFMEIEAIVMPLFFASNALYPIQMVPPILREFSSINSLSYVADAVRGSLITEEFSDLILDIIAIVTFDIVMFVAASMSFKRIIE